MSPEQEQEQEQERATIIRRPEEGQEEEDEANDEVEETCYGWLVVVVSFLCNLVVDGMGYSFGVMLQPLMHEFHVGAFWVSIAGSLQNGVYLLSSPLAAVCINRY